MLILLHPEQRVELISAVTDLSLPETARVLQAVAKSVEDGGGMPLGGHGHNIVMDEEMTEMTAATEIAHHLLRQIEEESMTSSSWLVSAVCKLLNDNPDMTLAEFHAILRDQLPEAFARYRKYCHK